MLSLGVTTGAAISGQSRVTATAKSPLSGAIGDAQAGGFWPAEAKAAGFDAIVITRQGREAGLPVGRTTARPSCATPPTCGARSPARSRTPIQEELGDAKIEVLQCGPAGEQGVRFACHDQHEQPGQRAHRHGRGDGLQEPARPSPCAGTSAPRWPTARPCAALARWGAQNFRRLGCLWHGHSTARPRCCCLQHERRRAAHPQLGQRRFLRATRRSPARP